MKINALLKTGIVKMSLLSLLSALLLTGAALAQDVKRDHSKTGQAADAADDLKVWPKLDSSLAENFTTQALLSAAPGAATFGATLTVQVDHSYCRTGGVQCFLPGQAPGDLNRNPVRLGIQVLNGGVPVLGLTDADIDVFNPFVPAGGSAINQIACASCFQPAGNGIYTIFVAPAVGQTWKPGSYFVQVRVNVGGVIHRALAQIEVEF
ncbi:MAG: hypothetical protein HYR56_02235 [Acidobacteria bacterium]|nr:hypothetical protein [Acidobacteriota bacterium]MBI3421329.1 hypothetical protein [Acidobacteriota bacterium]